MDRHSFALGAESEGEEKTEGTFWISGRSDLTEPGDTIPKTTDISLLNT